MSKEEFISAMTGVAWVNRAISWDAVDCWGLIVMYYRHVLGLEFPPNNNYSAGSDFECSFSYGIKFWELADKFDGCMFVGYSGKNPVHVGLILDGRCFHARSEGSHVRMDNIRTLERVFTKLEFFKYAIH